MNVWQLFAAVLAVGVAVASVARLAQSRRWNNVVLLLQVAAIPEIAFIWFALNPGDGPSVEELAPVALAFYAVAIAGVLWSMTQRRLFARPTITLDVIDRQHTAAFVARIATVFIVTGVAFTFEPSLAILNLVANALWAIVWIPKRWRRYSVSLDYDVAVKPAAVFDFVSNTDNWPKYREEFASATPPGRLRAGTEITTRRRLNWLSKRGMKLADFVEVHSKVVAVGPGLSFTLAVAGRPDDMSRSEFADAPGGSRVTAVATGLLTFPQAALGFGLEMPGILAGRRAEMQKAAGTLKQLLEHVTPAT